MLTNIDFVDGNRVLYYTIRSRSPASHIQANENYDKVRLPKVDIYVFVMQTWEDGISDANRATYF